MVLMKKLPLMVNPYPDVMHRFAEIKTAIGDKGFKINK